MSGLLWRALLLIALTVAVLTVDAAPVKVAQSPGDVVTIFANDKLLAGVLIGVLVNLVLTLGKMIVGRERKDLEEIKEAVKLIRPMKEKQDSLEKHLMEKVPTHEQVENKILRLIHSRKDL